MELAGHEGVEPAAVLERWLDLCLMESLRLSEELCEEERAFRLEAARLALARIVPEGAGIEERMMALAFVSSHAAGLDEQARANSRFLAPEIRAAAQGRACRLLALAGRQAGVLARLRTARAEAEEAARRKAKAAALERQWQAKEREQAQHHGFDPPEAERTEALEQLRALDRDGP